MKSFDPICKKKIIQGSVFRFILTLITFYFIKKWTNPKYLYIILPISLVILDSTDTIFSKLYSFKQGYYKDQCIHTFFYQSIDKINDLACYVLAWYWFDLKSDPLFLVFCILRAFGVTGFLLTKKSYPLMIFPDLFKEYLIYRYLIPKGFNLLPIVIILKIGFEIFFHTQVNQSSY
jgi:hypothetical protein